MDKAARLIKELEELVSSERYPEALTLFGESCAKALDSISNPKTRKKLLLLAAKINIGNKLAREAGKYIDQLVKDYPSIENDFDYVTQKVNNFRLQSNYYDCSKFIDRCREKEWDESQANWLEYYAAENDFWKGNYFRAN